MSQRASLVYHEYAFDKYGTGPTEKQRELFERLLDGETASLGFEYLDTNKKRVPGQPRIASIRETKKARIILLQDESKNQWIVIKYDPNHDYAKTLNSISYLLKSADEDDVEPITTVTTRSPTDDEIKKLPRRKKEKEDKGKGRETDKFKKVSRYDGEFISLSPEQEKAFDVELPILLDGPPGSGKTLVGWLTILRKFITNHNILYVAQEQFLVNRMLDIIDDSQVSQNQENQVVALTYVELLKMLDPTLNDKTQVGQEEFTKWYKPERFGQQSTADEIYKEFRTLSGYESDKYTDIGVKDSIFDDKESRKKALEIYREYLKYLGQNGLFDIAFQKMIISDQFKDWIIFADECNDDSTLQIRQKAELAGMKNIIISYDSNQVLSDFLPKTPFIKESLFENQPINCIPLPSSFRFESSYNPFMARHQKLENYHTKGNAYKGENTAIVSVKNNQEKEELPGLLTDLSDEAMVEFTKKFSITDLVIVTPMEFVEEAKRKFPSHLVFSERQAKGSQFNNTLCYRIYSTVGFSQIARETEGTYEGVQLKQHRAKNKDRNLRVRPEFCRAKVILTRSRGKIFIAQENSYPQDKLLNFLGLDTSLAKKVIEKHALGGVESNAESIRSNPNEILLMAKDYYKDGLQDHALQLRDKMDAEAKKKFDSWRLKLDAKREHLLERQRAQKNNRRQANQEYVRRGASIAGSATTSTLTNNAREGSPIKITNRIMSDFFTKLVGKPVPSMSDIVKLLNNRELLLTPDKDGLSPLIALLNYVDVYLKLIQLTKDRPEIFANIPLEMLYQPVSMLVDPNSFGDIQLESNTCINLTLTKESIEILSAILLNKNNINLTLLIACFSIGWRSRLKGMAWEDKSGFSFVLMPRGLKLLVDLEKKFPGFTSQVTPKIFAPSNLERATTVGLGFCQDILKGKNVQVLRALLASQKDLAQLSVLLTRPFTSNGSNSSLFVSMLYYQDHVSLLEELFDVSRVKDQKANLSSEFLFEKIHFANLTVSVLNVILSNPKLSWVILQKLDDLAFREELVAYLLQMLEKDDYLAVDAFEVIHSLMYYCKIEQDSIFLDLFEQGKSRCPDIINGLFFVKSHRFFGKSHSVSYPIFNLSCMRVNLHSVLLEYLSANPKCIDIINKELFIRQPPSRDGHSLVPPFIWLLLSDDGRLILQKIISLRPDICAELATIPMLTVEHSFPDGERVSFIELLHSGINAPDLYDLLWMETPSLNYNEINKYLEKGSSSFRLPWAVLTKEEIEYCDLVLKNPTLESIIDLFKRPDVRRLLSASDPRMNQFLLYKLCNPSITPTLLMAFKKHPEFICNLGIYSMLRFFEDDCGALTNCLVNLVLDDAKTGLFSFILERFPEIYEFISWPMLSTPLFSRDYGSSRIQLKIYMASVPEAHKFFLELLPRNSIVARDFIKEITQSRSFEGDISIDDLCRSSPRLVISVADYLDYEFKQSIRNDLFKSWQRVYWLMKDISVHPDILKNMETSEALIRLVEAKHLCYESPPAVCKGADPTMPLLWLVQTEAGRKILLLKMESDPAFSRELIREKCFTKTFKSHKSHLAQSQYEGMNVVKILELFADNNVEDAIAILSGLYRADLEFSLYLSRETILRIVKFDERNSDLFKQNPKLLSAFSFLSSPTKRDDDESPKAGGSSPAPY